jgi:hypothetical protein
MIPKGGNRFSEKIMLKTKAALSLGGRLGSGDRPNAISIANERSGTDDDHIAVSQPFAYLGQLFGKQSDRDAPGFHRPIANHLDHRSSWSVQDRRQGNGGAAAPADLDRRAAKGSDAKPLIAADQNPNLAKLRCRADRLRGQPHLA